MLSTAATDQSCLTLHCGYLEESNSVFQVMADQLLSRDDRSSDVIVVHTLRAVLRGSSVAGSAAAEVLKLLEPSSRALKVLLSHLQVLCRTLVPATHLASHQICFEAQQLLPNKLCSDHRISAER